MTDARDLITDEEIEAVHANANFGGMGKRDVVNDGVLKAAFGYSTGHTQMCILHEHGLIRNFRATRRDNMTLTVKGQSYLRAVYGPHFGAIAAIAKTAGEGE